MTNKINQTFYNFMAPQHYITWDVARAFACVGTVLIGPAQGLPVPVGRILRPGPASTRGCRDHVFWVLCTLCIRDWQTLSVEGQMGNILGLVGHLGSLSLLLQNFLLLLFPFPFYSPSASSSPPLKNVGNILSLQVVPKRTLGRIWSMGPYGRFLRIQNVSYLAR